MGIFSRLTDIINSNLNALLDHAEEPEKMIRLMIQEMEDTLVEVRSAAAKTIADQKDAERKLRRLDDAQAEWQRKAELALSKDREDLAKGALIEKSKLAEMAAQIQEDLEHLSEALGRHENDVIKLESKLREARAKKATIEARYKTAENQLRVKRSLYDTRIEDAFLRFDKVDSRLDRLEGEAEALDLGRGQGRTLADEFASLETEDAIQAELDALKSKLKPAKKADQ
ncbi:phage shock protein PspA [Iodidimonas gelatinilytica]|uniref:Phage shock protein PspA n=1 Tax=Iodidimonas gelatinilytica TaxID=1236966 RepID=A0A5A7MNM4_9PROT|nr:phage shock protein PspA [Iodidimonas gelatinilytica]GEQ97234.1 phage shock protein PspA [Iodidimonas gelatinilytica]GEQ99565.1 phage shock protein PspA [Iodidimonas gelatinilytica]